MNKRRNFLTAATALFGTLGLGLLPSFKSKAQDKMVGSFFHVVYFWLKEPDNDSSRNKFLKSLNSFLDEVDVIQSRHVGTPAPTDRPVIDSSYTFSLIVSFNNKAEQDIYQDHASHKRFIAESAPLWERVQVYDSISI
jgi:hypothetical protein